MLLVVSLGVFSIHLSRNTDVHRLHRERFRISKSMLVHGRRFFVPVHVHVQMAPRMRGVL